MTSGILKTPEPCNIFPCVEGETAESPDTLSTEYETFANYAGVDEDGTAEKEVSEHLKRNHLRRSVR